MKMLKLSVFLAMACVVSCQLLDGIEECTSEEFILEIAECFATPFQNITFPFSQSSDYDSNVNIGRRLQSVSHLKDGAIRYTALSKLSTEFKSKHKEVMSHIETAFKAFKNKEKEFFMIHKLKNLNLKKMLNDYIRELIRPMAPMKEQLMTVYKTVAAEAMKLRDNGTIIDDILDRLCDEIVPEICDLINCLDGKEEEEFEDGLEWLGCLFTCDDLIPIGSCVQDKFSQCADGKYKFASNIIIKGVAGFFKLDKCYLKIEERELIDTISLTEGGEPEYIQFKQFMPPGAHCFDINEFELSLGYILGNIGSLLDILQGKSPECDARFTFSTSNYIDDILPDIGLLGIIDIGKPKCRDGGAMQQVAVGVHDYSDPNEGCSIKLTDENWNQTFRVPIVAMVDHKRDGNIDTKLTIKLKIDGTVIKNTKLNVTIIDRDPDNVSTCTSINDPHIKTFDGHYYNNLYEGYFYLYRHRVDSPNGPLPYEVQVIYQKCTEMDEATCTCAVAVRSGDDVFVIDKCRRKSSTCNGPSCQIKRVVMYTNGELTPGTRVFKRDDGMRFDVVLPHGTWIRIMEGRDMLNVYVTPSTYEKVNVTEGLCGTYDEIKENDLLMPDGTIYSDTGSGEREQPRPFCEAWRVPENERIFNGVVEAELSFDSIEYCKCNHIVLLGIDCQCGYGEMVEHCNLMLDGEITANLSAISRRSRKDISVKHPGALDINTDDIDVDLDYSPPDFQWTPSYNQSHAQKFCKEYITDSTDEFILECTDRLTLLQRKFFDTMVYQCEDDILFTASEDWAMTALHTAKQACIDENIRVRDRRLEKTPHLLANHTCLNDCNDRGDCIDTICHCDSGYTGGDCSRTSGASPIVIMDANPQCDSRYEDCRFVTVYGANFEDDGKLLCHVQKVEMTSNGYNRHGSVSIVDSIHVSSNQLICKLPSHDSYIVSLYWAEVPVASQKQLASINDDHFLFMSYDSVCFSCASSSCSRKQANDHCYVKDVCYENNQFDANDECYLCNTTNTPNGQQINELAWNDASEVCQQRAIDEEDKRKADAHERNIRIAVACSLTAFVIVVTIILFFVQRKKEKSAQAVESSETKFGEMSKETKLESDDAPKQGNGSVFAYDNAGYKGGSPKDNEPAQYESLNEPAPTPTLPNPAVEHLKLDSPGPSHNHQHHHHHHHSDANADLEERKRAAQAGRNERGRTDSTSSARSLGIGGGGPMAFSGMHPAVIASEAHPENFGIGGHATPGVGDTPVMHRKGRDDLNVTTMF